jgi:hypothetical protein
VTEPQGNHSPINARLEQVHGCGVSQAMNGHALVRQRRTHLGRGLATFVQRGTRTSTRACSTTRSDTASNKIRLLKKRAAKLGLQIVEPQVA